MQIDIATPADAPGIASVHVRAWQVAYAHMLDPAYLAGLSIDERAAQWREILAGHASETRVARAGARVLGFVSHGRCRDPGAPRCRGEIWALYVDPDAWGQGAGKALVQTAVQALGAAGHSAVSLWVLADNARGIAFYAACGFARVPGSEQYFELGGRRVQEVKYLRPLDGAPAA